MKINPSDGSIAIKTELGFAAETTYYSCSLHY